MKNARYLLIALIGAQFPGNMATAQQSAPMPVFKTWATVAEKDIVWRRREWIEIDAAKPGNDAFKTPKPNPVVSSLADNLITEVLSGSLTAYSAKNDRFTDKLSAEELSELKRSYTSMSFVKYQLKEDSLSIGPDGRMEVRILGLAPIAIVKDANGRSVEQPLFWIYYPDNRQFLSQSLALHNGRHTSWDAILEGRQFNSRVVKSNDRVYRAGEHKQ